MTDQDPPDPPHEEYPESYETFWGTDKSGEQVAFGRDDRGNEFQLDAGSLEPVEGRCGATLRDSQRRYGEKRYCTRLPASKFPGYETDYCKLHRSMDDLEDRWDELFKHGFFAESYRNVAQHLSPTKFLFAIEMVAGLFEQSRHEFDVAEESVALDTSSSPLVEEDVVVVDIPVPQNNTLQFQANELWMAALDEVRMRLMQDVIFEDGVSTGHTVATAEMEGTITDRITEGSEHHLNLPLSRLTKDIKEHLKNGGVEIKEGDDTGTVTFQKNDYTLDVTPDEGAEGEPAGDVAAEFTEGLQEDDATVIEAQTE